MENKDNQWNKLYENYINKEFKNWDEYFKTKMKLKKKFLNQVLKYYDRKKPVLECGAGTGKFSAYLASKGVKAYAMDLEQAMVEQAKELSKHVSPENEVNIFQGDIRNIPFENKFFSVTHSSGVMEHYSDDEIISIINEQLRVSDVCVFSVPTPYFEKKMLGMEGLLKETKGKK